MVSYRKEDLDYSKKQDKIIDAICSNYVKKMKTDDLVNLMTQLSICLRNRWEFEIPGIKIDFKI